MIIQKYYATQLVWQWNSTACDDLKLRFVSITEPYFATALALIMANQDGMLPKGFGEILRYVNYVMYVAYHISVESLICPYVRM